MVTDKQIFLCIGDNSSKDAWGHKLSEKYALENEITFRGEITTGDQDLEPGCYHTGTYRLEVYDLIKLAKKVKSHSDRYEIQLNKCRKKLDKKKYIIF